MQTTSISAHHRRLRFAYAAALVLLAAGIGFPLGQPLGIDWALRITCLAWCMALGAIGTQSFTICKR
jgi:hypothetical protein